MFGVLLFLATPPQSVSSADLLALLTLACATGEM